MPVRLFGLRERVAMLALRAALTACVMAPTANAQQTSTDAVRPLDVWLACRHPKADSAAVNQINEQYRRDSSVLQRRAVLSDASSLLDSSTAKKMRGRVDTLRTIFALDSQLHFLCDSLNLPVGATRQRANTTKRWVDARDTTRWRLPLPEKVLDYAASAYDSQRALQEALDTLAKLAGSASAQPLTLALYFAPLDTVIHRDEQQENLQRIVDAIRVAMAVSRDPITLHGRADYTPGPKIRDDSLNVRLAMARARALKLAILQTDNRIDERRLQTAIEVVDSQRVGAIAKLYLQSTQRLPDESASSRCKPNDVRPVCRQLEAMKSGLRVDSRAAGVRLPALALSPSLRIATEQSLARAESRPATVGVTPAQWATALTNVVAERAVGEIKLFAFEEAARKLCDEQMRLQLRSTCAVVGISEGGKRAPDVLPTLESVRSALRSDLAEVIPSLLFDLLNRTDSLVRTEVTTTKTALDEAEAARKTASANLERRLQQQLSDDAEKKLKSQLKKCESAVALARARYEAVLRRKEKLPELQQAVQTILIGYHWARRNQVAGSPLQAFISLRDNLDIAAFDNSSTGVKLRQLASIVATYDDAATTLLGEPSAGYVARDTAILYAARTLALGKPRSAAELSAIELINRGAKLVSAIASLDSSLKATTVAGDPASRLTLSASRFDNLLRIAQLSIDSVAGGTLAQRIDSIIAPARDILAASDAGNYRLAFTQLTRISIVSGTSQYFATGDRRRLLGFAIDVSEAQDMSAAENAIRSFVSEGGGFRRKHVSPRPRLGFINAYIGGIAEPFRSSGVHEAGWFLPVGLEGGWRLPREQYLGVLAYPIDLGAFAATRASGNDKAEPKTELYQAISPGIAIVYSPWRRLPFTVGITEQWRTVAGVARRTPRFSIFLAADVPLFP